MNLDIFPGSPLSDESLVDISSELDDDALPSFDDNASQALLEGFENILNNEEPSLVTPSAQMGYAEPTDEEPSLYAPEDEMQEDQGTLTSFHDIDHDHDLMGENQGEEIDRLATEILQLGNGETKDIGEIIKLHVEKAVDAMWTDISEKRRRNLIERRRSGRNIDVNGGVLNIALQASPLLTFLKRRFKRRVYGKGKLRVVNNRQTVAHHMKDVVMTCVRRKTKINSPRKHLRSRHIIVAWF